MCHGRFICLWHFFEVACVFGLFMIYWERFDLDCVEVHSRVNISYYFRNLVADGFPCFPPRCPQLHWIARFDKRLEARLLIRSKAFKNLVELVNFESLKEIAKSALLRGFIFEISLFIVVVPEHLLHPFPLLFCALLILESLCDLFLAELLKACLTVALVACKATVLDVALRALVLGSRLLAYAAADCGTGLYQFSHRH